MRYRPYGPAGQAVSAVTLSLGARHIARGPEAGCELIYAALEQGVNSYCLEDANPVLAEVLGEALKQVDRKLVQVSLTLGAGDGTRGSGRNFTAEGLTSAIDRALHASGLGWFDLALLHEPQDDELPQTSLTALKALRATERVRLLGVAGDGDVMDIYVGTGAFDVLSTPYHVNSPWQIRHRLRLAREQDMAIFVHGYFPESLDSARKAATVNETPGKKPGLLNFKRTPDRRTRTGPLAGAGTFAFLHQTTGWPAETICLGYAMLDPGVSSVVIEAADAERLAMLCAVPDRDMPPGLAAQIEMARISGVKAA